MNSIHNFFSLSNHYVQSTILRNKALGRGTDIKGCLHRYWSNPSCQGYHQIKLLRANPDPNAKFCNGLVQRLDESLKDGDPHQLVDAVCQFVLSKFNINLSEQLNQLYSAFKRKLVIIENKEYPLATTALMNELIDLDLKMLLSRPLGRSLIERVLLRMSPSTKLYIRPLNDFRFSMDVSTSSPTKGCLFISYGIYQNVFCQFSQENFYMVSTPTFLIFAHELLHFVHFLEGTFFHYKNPYLNYMDTNEEEARTIYNRPCCALHPTPDPCNEETLREAFSIGPRFFHQDISSLINFVVTPMEVDDKSPPSSSKEET